MAGALTDKFKKVGTPATLTNMTAPGKAMAASSFNVASGSGYPTDTAFIVAVRVVDSLGAEVANSYTEWIATITGTTLAINPVPVYGSDQVYAAGSTTQVYLPVSARRDNDVIDGILAHANQDGSLIGSAVRTALGQSASAGAGWTTLGVAPNTITANGNRSYQMVFNSTDLTATLSNGMRLLLQRTVTAPTQCTSLNGTTQYYSKSSPAGMTFTDDFTVSAWIKLTSYALGSIASRYNGTSGWDFQLQPDGTVILAGFNAGATNTSYVQSRQSVPLNKWVHIAAQLDMSTFTATTTTSYIMMDGVDIPASVTRGGSNPTALIQAGNLEIGSRNAGTQFFPGKLAQVAIYSAKVTQATILASISQTLVGTETSLISAYSFSNTINDLNANANNLTANGSAVATNLDTPFTQTMTGVTTGTTNYGIIMAIAFSTNTTITVQVPEGGTIPTSGGVSAVSYSGQKVPYGFPAQRGKWSVLYLGKSQQAVSSPSNGTWYQPNTLSQKLGIPIGAWRAFWEGDLYISKTSSGTVLPVQATLSTANNSESDNDLSAQLFVNTNTANTTELQAVQGRDKDIDLSAATDYFLNIRTTAGSIATISFQGQDSPTKIWAECAHL